MPHRLDTQAAPAPPSTSRFALRRQLGTGGFGIVYEAFDRERGLRVALKTLRRATPEAESRLKREFRSLLDLAHPNLVAPYDLVAAPNGLFFTMELVDGVDFLRWVRPGSAGDVETGRMSTTLSSGEGLPESGVRSAGPASSGSPGVLDEGRLRSCLRQLVDALTALHAAGIVHRDLKPSNVLVRPDGRVALLDYGLASALYDEHSLSRRFEGTPAYAAPEQAYGRAVGPAVDFYAAGCMLFEALTGRLPFEGASRAVLLDKETAPAPLVRSLVPDAPEDLATLADTWLRWDPTERLAPRFTPTHQVEGSLIGRERELEVLLDAFRRSRDRGVRVLVEGAGGIGKTSLLQRFCGALGPSVITLRGRCHPRESLAFNAFDEAIDGLARVRLADGSPVVSLLDEASRQALARRFPSLRQRGTAPAARPAPASDRTGSGSKTASEMELDGFAPPPSSALGGVEDVRATQALRTLLRRLAAEEPVVILLDDVHWVDAESQELLQALFREPDAPCVLTVLVQRSDLASAMAPQHDSSITRLTVEPLSEDATLRLAEQYLGRSGEDVARLAKASGGHPMLLRELATQSRQRREGVLESVDDAVHERIDTLPPTAAKVLHMLALSTSSLDESDLALALRLDVETVLRVVDELRNKALVRLGNERGKVAFEPSHQRVRAVAVGRIPRRAVADLHAKIAECLARDPRPEVLPLVAVHLARAGKASEARLLAEKAAEHAEGQLAFGEAAELYRLALTLSDGSSDEATGDPRSPSNEDRRRLRERRLQALLQGHRGADAAEEYLRLADDESPERKNALILAAARLLLMSGHLDRALPLLSALLSQSGQSYPYHTSEALMYFAKEQGHLALRRRLPLLSSGPKVRDHAAGESSFGAAPDSSRTPSADDASLWSIDVASSLSEGLGMIEPLRAAAFQARALRLALTAGEPTRIARLQALQAIYDGEGDTPGRRAVLASLPKLRAQAVAAGDTQATHLVDLAEAVLLALEGVRRGNVEGLAQIEERLRRETRGNAWFIQTARLLRFGRMRTYGDLEALRRVLPAFLRDAEERRDHFAHTSLTRYSAFLYLAADAPHEARRHLASAPWPGPGNQGRATPSFHVQHWMKLDAELEIALYEGEGVRALAQHHDALEAYQRSWLPRVQFIRTSMLSLEGRLALAVGASGHERKRSLRRAERAARALSSESLGLCDVRAELLWAGIEGLRGHRDRVVAHLERGLLLADREGAWTLSASARLILSRILLGDRGRSLRRAADELMRRERILAPDAYAAFEIPGC